MQSGFHFHSFTQWPPRASMWRLPWYSPDLSNYGGGFHNPCLLLLPQASTTWMTLPGLAINLWWTLPSLITFATVLDCGCFLGAENPLGLFLLQAEALLNGVLLWGDTFFISVSDLPLISLSFSTQASALKLYFLVLFYASGYTFLFLIPTWEWLLITTSQGWYKFVFKYFSTK